MRSFSLKVNGQSAALAVSREASLLQVLRNDLGLNAPKYGCGLGQCGACTVWVDGVAARSCVIPAEGVAGREITTMEGLAQADPRAARFVDAVTTKADAARWHPVQQAFNEAQAAQCGYCLNGMVMQAAALLARESAPSDARIRAELSGNLCRCGTHAEILQAVHLAAAAIRAGASHASENRGSATRASDAEPAVTGLARTEPTGTGRARTEAGPA